MTAIRPSTHMLLRGTRPLVLDRLFRAFAAWRERRAERQALLDILTKRGDRLLDDAGLDREAVQRRLDVSPISPWDRWQL